VTTLSLTQSFTADRNKLHLRVGDLSWRYNSLFKCNEKNYKPHDYKLWFSANQRDAQNPKHHKHCNLL